MKMSRKTLTAACAAAVLTAAAGANTASAQTVLKFAWQLPLTNYASKGAEQLAKCIQDKSAGAIKIETYPAGQLYRARQLYEAARNGTVEMAMFSLGSFATTDPLADAVYLPFLIPSQERNFEVLHGELGKAIDAIAAKANTQVLGYFAGSGGQFGNKVRPIRKPDDFKGLKIRVPGATAADIVKAFGGVPTTVDPAEVYLALQRGTIDGTNFPLTSFYDRKLYETVNHLTLTNVSFDPDVVVISSKAMAALAPNQRTTVTGCAAESEKWVRAEEQKLRVEYVGLLKEKGMSIVELTADEQAAFAAATESITRAFIEKNGEPAKKLVEAIRTKK